MEGFIKTAVLILLFLLLIVLLGWTLVLFATGKVWLI